MVKRALSLSLLLLGLCLAQPTTAATETTTVDTATAETAETTPIEGIPVDEMYERCTVREGDFSVKLSFITQERLYKKSDTKMPVGHRFRLWSVDERRDGAYQLRPITYVNYKSTDPKDLAKDGLFAFPKQIGLCHVYMLADKEIFYQETEPVNYHTYHEDYEDTRFTLKPPTTATSRDYNLLSTDPSGKTATSVFKIDTCANAAANFGNLFELVKMESKSALRPEPKKVWTFRNPAEDKPWIRELASSKIYVNPVYKPYTMKVVGCHIPPPTTTTKTP